jgi:hypothetical protein
MTKVEIIKETFEFYSEDTSRRSLIGKMCVYNGDNGNHCAFGRCMLEEYKSQGTSLKVSDDITVASLSSALNVKKLDDLLEERYRGHTTNFWHNIQRFHDDVEYWDADGITLEGQSRYDSLLKTYANK